jgi:hypothetical protein
MKNKNFWKSVIQLAISVLTAALTAISTTSCMGYGPSQISDISSLHLPNDIIFVGQAKVHLPHFRQSGCR